MFALVNGSVVRVRAAIGATGFDYRRLDAEGVDDFLGVGVYYGASPSDVYYHRDDDVFIVGGANSAGQAALHLAAHARSVTLLVRGETIEEQMSQYLVDRCGRELGDHHPHRHADRARQRRGEARADRDRVGRRAGGAARGRAVHPDRRHAVYRHVPVRHRARSPGVRDHRAPTSAAGGSWTDRPFFLESSQPGFFFAGDARLGSVKRVASAVGEGAMAVQHVHRYLAALD